MGLVFILASTAKKWTLTKANVSLSFWASTSRRREGRRWHKLFSRNTVHVRYCCKPNHTCAILNQNNTRVLGNRLDKRNLPARGNCSEPESCPPDGHWPLERLVYSATAEAESDPAKRINIGLTENSFQQFLWSPNVIPFKAHLAAKENEKTI